MNHPMNASKDDLAIFVQQLLAAWDGADHEGADDELTDLCRTAWFAATNEGHRGVSNLWMDIERDHLHSGPNDICADDLIDRIQTAVEITLTELCGWTADDIETARHATSERD